MSNKRAIEKYEALRERLRGAAGSAKVTVQKLDTEQLKLRVMSAAESTRDAAARSAGEMRTKLQEINAEDVRHSAVSAVTGAKELAQHTAGAAIQRAQKMKPVELRSDVRAAASSIKEKVRERLPNRGASSDDQAAADTAAKKIAAGSLEQSVDQYNDALAELAEKGLDLYMTRIDTLDLFVHIQSLCSGISGVSDLEELKDILPAVETLRDVGHSFMSVADSASLEVALARYGGDQSCSHPSEDTASILPIIAVWTAGTYGIAASDEAINILAGLSDTPPAAAWFDVGTLDTENCSMAGGTALLALAGPIAVTENGPILLSTISLSLRKRLNLLPTRQSVAELIRNNTAVVAAACVQIAALQEETAEALSRLRILYHENLRASGRDVTDLTGEQLQLLKRLCADAEALSELVLKTI